MPKTLAHAADYAEITQRIRSLTPNALRQWGSMTVAGMLCHLADSYELPLGERSAAAVSIPKPRLVKWMALHSPMRWPHGLRTLPEVQQDAGGSAAGDFSAERGRLLERLQRFCTARELERVPHPMFGGMSADDWMRWGYLHADHHLRQFNA